MWKSRTYRTKAWQRAELCMQGDFFINWERITQIVWHHMEFFLHIMYFLCRHCERRGLQGVLFRRRGGEKKLYVWWGRRGGGGSRGLVGRSKHAQRKYASCTRWTWGLRGLLSRLQERPVRRGAGERNHAAALHTQQGFNWTCFHCGNALFLDSNKWLNTYNYFKSLT